MMPLAFAGMGETAERLRRGEVGVGEVDAAARGQIARHNAAYRAFSHVAPPDEALCERLAAEIASGANRGLLHGLTASVKGNIPVAGLPFTEGSALFGERRAGQDARIVAKLRDAGAVVLGTTTLSELAMYGTTNAFEPMGLNPWNAELTAGGSSTGAGVAAALGMAHVNVGTDSGGSIRNPACHCGTVGLMPRIARLTTEGKPNRAPSLSSVGLIGRDVADVEVAFDVLAEPSTEPAHAPTRRLLVPRRLVEDMCDEETGALFASALAALARAGFDLIEQDMEGWLEAERGAGIISLHEGGRSLGGIDLTGASPGIRHRAETAARLTAEEVRGARDAGRRFRDRLASALREAEADAVVSPTWPFPAAPIDAVEALVRGRAVPLDPHRNCFVRVGNAVDACAVTLPMGLYPSCGVPAGLHLMALADETRLLRVAALAEKALPRLPLPPPVSGAREKVGAAR